MEITTYAQVIGQLVAHHRQAQALDQAHVAAWLGISQSAYSKLERGNSTFSVTQLHLVATNLGIPAGKLMEQAEQAILGLKARGVHVVDLVPPATPQKRAQSGAGLALVAAAVASVVFLAGIALVAQTAPTSRPRKKH